MTESQTLINTLLANANSSFGLWELVLMGTVVVSWCALLFALMAIRRIQKQSVSVHNLISQLDRDLRIASNGAVGMGQRIIRLERKLAQLQTGMVKDIYNQQHEQPDYTQDGQVERQGLTSGNTLESVLQGIAKQTVSLKVQKGSKPANSHNRTVPHNRTIPHDQTKPSLAVIDGPNKSDSAAQHNNTTRTTPTNKSQPQPKPQSLAHPKLTPFEQAEKLFTQGLEAEEIARRCGLSQSEAALMQLIHRQQSVAAN